MVFKKDINIVRWIVVVISFIIISLILWNTYTFFQYFKEEQRYKMNIWSSALVNVLKQPLKIQIDPVTSEILTYEHNNQVIIVREDNEIETFNIFNEKKLEDRKYIDKLINTFEKENSPIKLSYLDPTTKESIYIGTLYYGNSVLLNKLKYYPFALLLIIFLFGAVIYFFYSSNKNAIQNKLWSGMAKETAHQIGTPLSSLIGWTEILKSENVNPDYIVEIEKDVDRLKTITERFSKIGSIPTLEVTDIVKETIDSYHYLKSRSSKLIDFEIIKPSGDIPVNLNKQLYSWTIENLVKNAIDAMKGRGKLIVEISQLENNVKISVTDTGKGIAKKDFNRVFEPGYTTKKRGWGLGLSLTKRIIEDFHGGKIKVLQSEKNKGTTIEIALKRTTNV